METISAAIVAASLGIGGTALIALITAGWRSNGVGQKQAVDFAKETAANGAKIDNLHQAVERMVTEQGETTKAVVRVATLIERNGGRT